MTRRSTDEPEAAGPTNEAAPPASHLSYTLDLDDRIIAVTGNWDGFALANGGPAILSATIIGRRLDEFVSGDVTRMFVRTMLMSARMLKRSIHRPYRCDSPQLRRFMEMTVMPHGGGMLEVRHRQIRCEPLSCTVTIASVAAAPTSGFIKRCSICNHIRIRQVWSEVDEAILDGRLAKDAAAALRVIYGVCPDCLRASGRPMP